jgi:hypothetical protein
VNLVGTQGTSDQFFRDLEVSRLLLLVFLVFFSWFFELALDPFGEMWRSCDPEPIEEIVERPDTRCGIRGKTAKITNTVRAMDCSLDIGEIKSSAQRQIQVELDVGY